MSNTVSIENISAAAARRMTAAAEARAAELGVPSVIAICDGKTFLMLPAARDYKRAYDRDRGGNTGGMGAFAPLEQVDAGLECEIGRRIVTPVLRAMEERGTPFRGALYCGLMVNREGFSVLEFNCRFGDPETQVILPLVEGNLCELLASAADGNLSRSATTRGRGAAVAVALVDEDYPDSVRGDGVIEGLEALMSREEIVVFHGACDTENGRWLVRGGRAVYVMSHATNREEARDRVYRAIADLGGAGWRFRRDVAFGDGAAHECAREFTARVAGGG